MAARFHGPGKAVGDVFVVLAVSTVTALTWNALQSDGIPLIPDEPPSILVPCPEPVGDAEALPADQVAWGQAHDLVIDARPQTDFDNWHAPGAMHIIYDFLDPVSDDAVGDLVASGSRRIIIYGDGGPADTGKQLAQELSGRGVRNVGWVAGGVSAARTAAEGGTP